MSPSIRLLIVDDDPMMAGTLVDIVRMKGYEAEAATSSAEALAALREQTFNCVLSDIKMPAVDGVDLCRTVRASQPDMLVVLMTAYAEDARVQKALDEGVVAVLEKPLDLDRLMEFLSMLEEKRAVTIVDDDPHFCRTMGDVLAKHGHTVRSIGDPHDVVERLGDRVQTVLLDMGLNGSSGLDVLREIRGRHPHLPVVVVTGYGDEMATAIDMALQTSAHACLHKPLEIEALLAMLSDLRRRELGRVLGRPVRKTKWGAL